MWGRLTSARNTCWVDEKSCAISPPSPYPLLISAHPTARFLVKLSGNAPKVSGIDMFLRVEGGSYRGFQRNSSFAVAHFISQSADKGRMKIEDIGQRLQFT